MAEAQHQGTRDFRAALLIDPPLARPLCDPACCRRIGAQLTFNPAPRHCHGDTLKHTASTGLSKQRRLQIDR
ncbi:hypothetical protein GALL_397340 [mine drainage metagenome]|uniref:Uncharacterized protein n=1 Tax=mine drainage metagenome TaxID=410659 RepID=A0A1J5Q5A8_9ZZZZ